MNDRPGTLGPARHPSGLHVARPHAAKSHDLRVALEQYDRRWSSAAVAAACCLPETTCDGVMGWAELLDELDEAIRDVISR